MKRELPPARRAAVSISFELEGHKYAGWAGYNLDHKLIELWLRSVKPGSTLDTLASEAGIMASLLLQGGMAPERLKGSLGRGPIAKLLDLVLELKCL